MKTKDIRRSRDDSGFTLIEVLIALFLVTSLALFTLPLMAAGLRYTSIASTSAAANSRVQQTVEQARTTPITCASLQSLVGTQTFTDGRNIQYTITTALPSGCTANANAQTIPVTVVARRVNGNILLTNLTTRILVPGTAPTP